MMTDWEIVWLSIGRRDPEDAAKMAWESAARRCVEILENLDDWQPREIADYVRSEFKL